jgi:hypothetical protein
MNYDILTVLREPELTSGRPFPGLTNAAPLPASEIRLDRMQFTSLYDSRVNLNGYWLQPGDLRQCRERFWHLEAATSAFSLEFLGLFPCSSTSKIQVLDLVPCPTMEKVRVKKMEKRKVRVR